MAVVCLLMLSSRGEAQAAVPQVLVLQSFDRGNLVLDAFTANLRVDLDQRAGTPMNVVQVVVGPAGLVGAPEEAVVDFIRSTFADRPQPDLIVTIAGPAAAFARKHRGELFPDAPLLFASVDQRWLRDAPLGDNETAVVVDNDFAGLVDEILRLLPETRQVFMVVGSGVIGRFWRSELEGAFKRFPNRLTFIWSDDLSFQEILRRTASLPAHSAIFYIHFGTDAAGAAYADERVLADLHRSANAPMFSRHSVYLGSGIVGGALMPVDKLARDTADAAIRILNGESPQSGGVRGVPGIPIFDWRELQRWGIDESRLPPGSIVSYRGPSLWGEYRGAVLGAVGILAIQALLIVVLLFERRARQRAEIDSRRNLALAADASRRATMSALTNSIAHELGQPLSAMMLNATALRRMVAANSATSDTLEEVLSDIETEGALAKQIIERHRTILRGHRLEKKPIDVCAVVSESIALVAHDMRSRQIETTVDLPSTPCIVAGDPVLLQQVLVNLLVNAMDAMADSSSARRHITIRSDVRAADVEVSVRDTGPGLPADFLRRPFAPFVTTKSNGLGIGLTIARTIIDAHDGTIVASNNPEGGATFTITLLRSEVPDSASVLLVSPSATGQSPTAVTTAVTLN